MQQIYTRTPMPKCYFNKVAKQESFTSVSSKKDLSNDDVTCRWNNAINEKSMPNVEADEKASVEILFQSSFQKNFPENTSGRLLLFLYPLKTPQNLCCFKEVLKDSNGMKEIKKC